MTDSPHLDPDAPLRHLIARLHSKTTLAERVHKLRGSREGIVRAGRRSDVKIEMADEVLERAPDSNEPTETP